MIAPARLLNAALRPVPVWLVYLAGALPAVWLGWLLMTGGLGVDPAKRLEHALGLHALQFLIAGLAITPLRRLTGVNLLRWRRALGLIGFSYVVLHLLVWLVLDLQLRWAEIGADILKRPYVTVGMAAFALLIPLAWTSRDSSIRRIGIRRWSRLHLLVYPAVLAGALHHVLLVKSWPLEPMLYLLAVLLLLGLRLFWWLGRFRRSAQATG